MTSIDIFNRPPSIAEDTLVYLLNPPPGQDDKSSVLALAASVRSYVESLLPGFIWHRDSFDLKVAENSDGGEGEWRIEGRMRVGDSVDDEWLVVWLLKEISAKWDLAIEVFDSDGEFLLIEAADVLPTWVKPANSENRVWIYNFRLHLIPISYVSPSSRKPRRRRLPGGRESDEEDIDIAVDEIEECLASSDALRLLRDPLTNTLAPKEIEDIVWKRISRYPAAAGEHLHRAKAHLPLKIAKALSADPLLIQPAVETFYTRDALQLRAAHRMVEFQPCTSVLTTVKLTRVAYAQLVGQKIFPPRVFGKWQETESSPQWRWRDIGMKISIGFEMLYHESRNRKSAASQGDDVQLEFLRQSPEYISYIQRLVHTGYFKNEIEDSHEWKELELSAMKTFIDLRRDDASRLSFSDRVKIAIKNSQTISNNNPRDEDEDSENWMSVDPATFDSLFENKVASKDIPTASGKSDREQGSEDQATSGQVTRLQKLASQVEDFVEGRGDLEGAVFADEQFSDFSNDEPTTESEADSDDEELPMPQKQDEERKAALDRLVPALEPSEFGKMPASYSKSQRTTPATVETDRIGGPFNEFGGKASKGRAVRQPILPRDSFDGVDSDDETDSGGENDSDEDKPEVVGDFEIDMRQEEQEFLEFSREALGITDDQWNDILKDRKARGVFIPHSAKNVTNRKKSGPEAKFKMPTSEPKPDKMPDWSLNSFEAVMQALDDQLRHVQAGKQPDILPPPSQTQSEDRAKGKEKAFNADEDEEEAQGILAAMEAELKSSLERGDDSENEGEDKGDEEKLDYNLIKNFLMSFKSQQGASGPVGNLMGRLQPGWKLPRDES